MSGRRQVCKKRLTKCNYPVATSGKPTSTQLLSETRKRPTTNDNYNHTDSSDTGDNIDNQLEINIRKLKERLAVAERKEQELQSRVRLHEIGFLAYKTAHALHSGKIERRDSETQTSAQQDTDTECDNNTNA